MQCHSNFYSAVQRNEKVRLEIMMRFTKYSIGELKQIFQSIDVETEARRILANSGGVRVKRNGFLHRS